jgi:alpha-beta hydrolase superfamily lysophospholipase
MADEKLRVLFIHGLEGSPQGTKARTLGAAFHTETPAMDTRDFEGSVAHLAERVRRFEPDVVVGSSFGGGVAVALLQREQWRGPTLLLAQAALKPHRNATRQPRCDRACARGCRVAFRCGSCTRRRTTSSRSPTRASSHAPARPRW